MKKILLVSIIQNHSDDKGEITSLLREMDCTKEEEVEIHRAVTSTRDPNVLFDILTNNQSPEEIEAIKNDYSMAREKIRASNTIKVTFIPLEKCEDNCDMCIMRAFHEKDFEVMFSIEDVAAKFGTQVLVLSFCDN